MAITKTPLPASIPRAEFLDDYWDYRPGEHVTIIGPTGCGKTWLGYELLDRSVSERLPAVMMVMKPRDATAKAFTKRLRFRTVRAWPPLPSIWQPGKPRGYTLWPKHSYDPERDDYNLWKTFRAGILDSYKKGKRILFADEAYGLCAELRLEKELITVWSRGRSMGTGLWAATQRPTHVPLWAYSQAEHLFLFRDPDKRARERYAEIGGVDPAVVLYATDQLAEYECLYIRRRGGVMAILTP
jgi:hypothetical protein